ncbi:MAG: precorrin-6y C5,15-methyltransferase (decarboxylating) subunit CbiE [Oscillatoriales cyanobacterium RM2_1_1]|nr:precorrin-6y C5,15-methyltransferase (decarboxylating) subunit CbiE [Oscillatoriales cyanobacterium RM2_1_1]
MTIHVVGIGLDGAAGLPESLRRLVTQAAVLVGSDRHLNYFSNSRAQRIVLGDLITVCQRLQRLLKTWEAGDDSGMVGSQDYVALLVSGDPLFFGFGRLLLAQFPPEQLTFYPQVSSIQLAFNRLKVPWQDAQIISAHGRSSETLTQALRQRAEKIAVLTDNIHTPTAIAGLLLSLDLATNYEFWVCENLGGVDEQIQQWEIEALQTQTFAPLNVVVLLYHFRDLQAPLDLNQLPRLGIPDSLFHSYGDRPGLITKREVRTLVLGELALQPGQVVWDVGAGTGSVSIEIARLFPESMVYAVERTAAGTILIEQNIKRFQVNNVISIHGEAPKILHRLQSPQRIFVGGSGGNLSEVLGICSVRLQPGGVMVMAFATLEHLTLAQNWLVERMKTETTWRSRLLQVQLAHSVAVGNLTRFAPLNPVTILTIHF